MLLIQYLMYMFHLHEWIVALNLLSCETAATLDYMHQLKYWKLLDEFLTCERR